MYMACSSQSSRPMPNLSVLYFTVFFFTSKPDLSKMSCSMKYKMDVIVLMMYFYVFFTLLIIIHNKQSDKLKVKQRITKEIDVLSMKTDDFKTSERTSTGGQGCSRKDHVVYIKTHKTGSTTAAHIFWR